MSYNIDTVHIVHTENAWMSKKDYNRLKRAQEELPEDCFLYERPELDPNDPDRVLIKSLNWRGCGSGGTFDSLREKILPKVHGRIDAVFVWEGGDSVSGLRVVDGKVTEHSVTYVLGEEEEEEKDDD